MGLSIMRKTLAILLSIGIAVTFSFAAADTAEAKVKTYANCKELNKDYKGGVAKAAGIKNKGGKTKYKPYVSKSLYEANIKKDRDKDGIACER